MSFHCKVYCSNCVVCNRAKPSRRVSSSLSLLGVPNHPWEIVGMDFGTDLPKSPKFNFNTILIDVYRLTKRTHFVPYIIKKLNQKKLPNSSLIILIHFMVFLKSSYLTVITNLLANFSNHS
jgi:hypothetical protein